MSLSLSYTASTTSERSLAQSIATFRCVVWISCLSFVHETTLKCFSFFSTAQRTLKADIMMNRQTINVRFLWLSKSPFQCLISTIKNMLALRSRVSRARSRCQVMSIKYRYCFDRSRLSSSLGIKLFDRRQYSVIPLARLPSLCHVYRLGMEQQFMHWASWWFTSHALFVLLL